MSATRRGLALRDLGRLFRNGALPSGDGALLECFLAEGDESAFEAIVARHGPMVLGVCRRLLGDPHDADDAFQATFLVLVQQGPADSRRRTAGAVVVRRGDSRGKEGASPGSQAARVSESRAGRHPRRSRPGG